MSSSLLKQSHPAKRRPQRPELADEQKQEIKEAFDLFDINKDGCIDYHELKYGIASVPSVPFRHELYRPCLNFPRKLSRYLQKPDQKSLRVAMRALGFDAKKAEVLKLLKDHDKDGRGLMEFDDFQRIMTQKILDRDPVEEIKKAFQLFDDDGTGKISLKNLRRVAKELGEDIDDEELQAMIDEFDLDNDGESKFVMFCFDTIWISLCGLGPYAVNEQEFIAIMTESNI